jgi:4-amino-4-deoxy-L-arabinose transferase
MLSRSRLPLYLLPIFPAIALAIARGLAPAFASDSGRRRIERIVYASIAAFIASKGVAAYVPSKKDATRIHREAVAAAGPGARFALFGDHELYGFQFHERGDLERWSATGDERWAHRGLDAALASRDRERPNAIVVRARRASEFEAALRERALPFRRVSLTGKELFVLD